MVVVVKIGRRQPRKWMQRKIRQFQDLFTFQENLWRMILIGLEGSKKKVTQAQKMGNTSIAFSMQSVEEPDAEEPVKYFLEWRIVTLSSPVKSEEEAEYKDALRVYDSLGVYFKKNKKLFKWKRDNPISKPFKSKLVNEKTFNSMKQQAVRQGKGKPLVEYLLDAGILYAVERE